MLQSSLQKKKQIFQKNSYNDAAAHKGSRRCFFDARVIFRVKTMEISDRRGRIADAAFAAVGKRLIEASRKSALLFLLMMPTFTPVSAAANYVKIAREAGEWIRASAVKKTDGTIWLADPNDAKSETLDLYSGSPGVILFFIEFSKTTKDKSYLKDARAGADYLIARLPEIKETGLYEGIAGLGFVFIETYKATKNEKYRQAAQQVVKLLKERANEKGAGAQWSETTDIISGNAGTGLFLLYAARELKDDSLRDLAAKAGRRLIEVGRAETVGTKWAMDDVFPRLMPNFSHGTAGVSYFLATLYRETKRKEFLDAALAGAEYLKSIAETDGDVCLIFHNEPNGKDLYYLSWCHGPAGTARLFYRLYEITNDKAWMDWVERAARGVMKSGVPERQTAGLWNNVGQCCGTAGIGEFSLNLYQVTNDKTYLEYTRRITDNLLARAAKDAKGTKWIHAEHRVRPDLLIAQTGFMQGASGIGMFLLRLDAAEKKRKPFVTFPDTPFN